MATLALNYLVTIEMLKACTLIWIPWLIFALQFQLGQHQWNEAFHIWKWSKTVWEINLVKKTFLLVENCNQITTKTDNDLETIGGIYGLEYA